MNAESSIFENHSDEKVEWTFEISVTGFKNGNWIVPLHRLSKSNRKPLWRRALLQATAVFYPLNIVVKLSILDVWSGFGNLSTTYKQNYCKQLFVLCTLNVIEGTCCLSRLNFEEKVLFTQIIRISKEKCIKDFGWASSRELSHNM